ncbi:MAG: hypothetical protein JXB13_08985 [Phycisphaerae bacterium]|nr:hypothetical protein [Phycisphaerae bacterium]
MLRPPTSTDGYLARLLINETPFPGERGWVSEADTKAAMLQILWVLHSRIAHVPPGYRQVELASVTTKDILDVITAGGVHGQCDGFYRKDDGTPAVVARVPERLGSLLRIANQGKPGHFARLIDYAQGLSSAYFRGGIDEADRFAGLSHVGNTRVTGRAYSWMQDRDYYHPGGDFVKIPDAEDGSLGGNRFSTLKERK